MNLGFIGNSKFAHFWATHLRNSEFVKLHSIYSSDMARAEEACKEFNIEKAFDNLERMVEDPELDIVIVTSVPSLHYEQTMTALKHKKHVLVEKPPALNPEQFAEMNETAKANGVYLAVDYMMRYNPLYRKLNDIITSKALGNLLNFQFNNYASDANLPSEHWFWDKAQSGGIFVEHGVHFFDIYNSILGKPELLFSKVYNKDEKRKNRVIAVVEYPSNINGIFTHVFDRASVDEETFSKLFFEHGSLIIKGWYPYEMFGEIILPTEKVEKIMDNFDAKNLAIQDFIIKIDSDGKINIPAKKIKIELKLELEKMLRKQYLDLLEGFVRAIKSNVQPATCYENVKESLEIAYKAASFG